MLVPKMIKFVIFIVWKSSGVFPLCLYFEVNIKSNFSWKVGSTYCQKQTGFLFFASKVIRNVSLFSKVIVVPRLHTPTP